MARATDGAGASGPAFGKPARLTPGGLLSRSRDNPPGSVRVQPGGPAVRQGRSIPARRVPPAVETSLQFLKDVRAEMNRVAWPDRQTVIASSLVVVFVLAVTAAYLAGWDLILAEVFKQILQP
jgi:preprotein translocase SecE subunit